MFVYTSQKAEAATKRGIEKEREREGAREERLRWQFSCEHVYVPKYADSRQ